MQFLHTNQFNEFTDTELVLLFKQNGDTNVLGALYQRYMDLLLGVCIKYLKDMELAKDAVLQVYEDLGRKLEKHDVENFRSWIHTVTKNHCLMYLRSPKNKPTVSFEGNFMQSEEIVHLNGELENEANFNKLENCLKTLNEEQQRAVTLFYYQQKCYKEIAEMTGNEASNVRSFIQNGRRNLKICMEKN